MWYSLSNFQFPMSIVREIIRSIHFNYQHVYQLTLSPSLKFRLSKNVFRMFQTVKFLKQICCCLAKLEKEFWWHVLLHRVENKILYIHNKNRGNSQLHFQQQKAFKHSQCSCINLYTVIIKPKNILEFMLCEAKLKEET
jgi:hypothetical protein